MSKAALVMFAINFLLLLVCIALMIPIAIWQWVVVVATGSWCVRSWLAARKREEQLDAIYGGKNVLPKSSRAPTYHER
jgi:hypothetical protein